MAYFDDPVTDPTLDFDARDLALTQQAARIKAMRAAAAQSVQEPAMSPGWNSAVTGTHIGGQTLKTPTAALLNPLVNQVGADFGDIGLVNQTDALTRAKQANAEEAIGGLPAAPTAADFQKLSANPLTRAVAAKAVEDRLIQAPIRASTERIATAKEAAAAVEKAKDRAATLEAANIRANQPSKALHDSGLVTSSGAKIYFTPNADGTKTYNFAGQDGSAVQSATPPDGSQRVAPEQPVSPATPVAGATAPVSLRNNNPGNLRYTDGTPGFRTFPSYEEGVKALDADLAAKGAPGRNLNTVNKLMAIYAPTGDNNNPAQYAATVAKNLGIGPDDPIDLSNAAQRHLIGAEIAKFESGNGAAFKGAPAVNGAPVNPRNQLPEGARVAPQAIDATTRKEIASGMGMVTQYQNLKAQYNNLPKPVSVTGNETADKLISGVVPNQAGQSFVSPKDQQVRSQFWANFEESANERLRAMSGLAVTDSEMQRFKATVPNKFSSDEAFNNWVDRSTALAQTKATREQALADNKFARMDPKLNAVVDTSKNPPQVVPGTESPFTAAELKGGGSLPRAKAGAAPAAPDAPPKTVDFGSLK